MRNTWLEKELKKITEEKYQETIKACLAYIEELEDDNESLQISLEGNIWSPKKWNEKK